MSPLRPAGGSTADYFRVYDYPFRLRSNRPDVRRIFAKLYGPFRQPLTEETQAEAVFDVNPKERFVWRLGEKHGAETDLSAALWELEAALCESVILHQQSRIAIHGGAVYSEHSAAIVVGRSGTGKSTLSLALARRGFAVASDDVTLIEPATLDLLPMPRCYHLDRRSVALLKDDGFRFPRGSNGFRFMVPADLGVRTFPARRAGRLIFMTGARSEFPEIVPISQAEMVGHLLAETGQGPVQDVEAIGVLARLAGAASCYRLVPGPLTTTADALADLLLEPNAVPGRAPSVASRAGI